MVIGFDCLGVCWSFVESNVSRFIRDLIRWKWINFSEKKKEGKKEKRKKGEGVQTYYVSSKILYRYIYLKMVVVSPKKE